MTSSETPSSTSSPASISPDGVIEDSMETGAGAAGNAGAAGASSDVASASGPSGAASASGPSGAASASGDEASVGESSGSESLDVEGSVDEGSVDEGSLDEGDIAADYIEELLDILDLDGDIDIETRAGRSYISVDSAGEGDLRLLSKPDTVNALQELTRIAVQTRTGEFSRLILDVGGSRATREQELTTLVDRAIAKLEEGATAASLPPMSSYERKLVHDIVASRGEFTSESEGEGRDRHTVVSRA